MADSGEGMVGAATVNITPIGEIDSWGGTTLRRDEEEDSDLLAHAVVISDGQRTGALVSLDIALIDRPNVLAIREACSVHTGIPGQQITIGADQTHVAPRAAPSFLVNRESTDYLYVDYLQRQVVQAVARAKERMRPARMAFGNAPTEGLAFNRRYLASDGRAKLVFAADRDPSLLPAGPTDEDLGYILFEEPDGTPVALVTSFAPHNHVVGGCPVPGRGPDRYFHRDFYGRFGDEVRRRLGPDVPTATFTGACGDMAWQNPQVQPPVDGAAAAWALGRTMADALFDHSPARPRVPIKDLQFASEVIEIPDRPLEKSHFCGDHCDCRGSSEEIHAVDRRRYDQEERVLRELRDRGDTDTRCVLELSAIAIGDVGLSTNPGESFVELGLEIKERSPFPVTMILGLTNGCCGYVPTERAFDEGGYETHRSVFTSRLATSADRTVVEECVNQLVNCRRLQGRPGSP